MASGNCFLFYCDQQLSLEPGRRYSIGRKDADIELPDGLVSRDHGEIDWREGQFWIVDHESRNGTLVNGFRVREHKLLHGDKIKIGSFDLEFTTKREVDYVGERTVSPRRAQEETTAPEGSARPNIVVLMPFGGGDPVGEKRARLEFLRLRYLINLSFPDKFKVEYCFTSVADIVDRVLPRIRDAGTVIAIYSAPNDNVLFEIAFRFALRDKLIVCVAPALTERLPIYLEGRGYVEYRIDPHVSGIMEEIAKDASLEDLDAPDKEPRLQVLEGMIKTYEKDARSKIRAAIQEIIDQESEVSPWVRDMLGRGKHNLPPMTLWADVLNHPCAIIRIEWKRKSLASGYATEDIVTEPGPVYHDANSSFADLFNLTEEHQKLLQQGKLPVAKALDHLKTLMDPQHVKSFDADQEEVRKWVIFKEKPVSRYTIAHVPIRIEHGNPDYRGRQFWPCIFGRYLWPPNADLGGPHATYLVVVYFELGLYDLRPVFGVEEAAPQQARVKGVSASNVH